MFCFAAFAARKAQKTKNKGGWGKQKTQVSKVNKKKVGATYASRRAALDFVQCMGLKGINLYAFPSFLCEGDKEETGACAAVVWICVCCVGVCAPGGWSIFLPVVLFPKPHQFFSSCSNIHIDA